MSTNIRNSQSIFVAAVVLISAAQVFGQSTSNTDGSPLPDAPSSSSSQAGAAGAAGAGAGGATPSTTPTLPTNVSLVAGLGFAGPSDSPDYTLSSTTLSSTHEGKATPQYMLGLAYSLGLHYHALSQWSSDCSTTPPTGTAKTQDQINNSWRCYPLGAFVSAKFSTESSSAVSGVTFGITQKLVPNGSLSLLIAGSLSPFQQPSPGFINAAVQTVIAQKAANNPFYSQFDPVAMKSNAKDAFDGFPTVLMTNSGSATSPTYTAGPQIYTGTVLINNYKPGFLIGVALTPNISSLITKAQ